jgi:hypothetical protein
VIGKLKHTSKTTPGSGAETESESEAEKSPEQQGNESTVQKGTDCIPSINPFPFRYQMRSLSQMSNSV